MRGFEVNHFLFTIENKLNNYMANKKISEFPKATTLLPNDIFLMDQLGGTKTAYLSTVSSTILNTVTASTWATDNFIPKPTVPAPKANDVLYYNDSTSTWSATALSAVQVASKTSIIPDSLEFNLTGLVSLETEIPSYAKKITIVVENISMRDNSRFLIRVRPTGGYNQSTYTGSVGAINNNFTAEELYSTPSAFLINVNSDKNDVLTGQFTLIKVKEGRWHFSGITSNQEQARSIHTSGRVDIAGAAPITHIQMSSSLASTIDVGQLYYIFE